MGNNNIPPTDGKHYWFNEQTQVWLEVALDSNGLALTPERILQLKPYPSWVRNENNTAWIPPIVKPEDEVHPSGAVLKSHAWDEESVSWIEINLKPYESWEVTDSGEFVPPIAKPDNGLDYIWNEDNLKWVRDPMSFTTRDVIWDNEAKDFTTITEKLGVKYTDDGIDISFEKQEWPSWTIGDDGRWRAPVAYPNTGKLSYEWDEYEQEWYDTNPEYLIENAPHNRLEMSANNDGTISSE